MGALLTMLHPSVAEWLLQNDGHEDLSRQAKAKWLDRRDAPLDLGSHAGPSIAEMQPSPAVPKLASRRKLPNITSAAASGPADKLKPQPQPKVQASSPVTNRGAAGRANSRGARTRANASKS